MLESNFSRIAGRREAGTAAIEFALVVPLFLLMVFAIMEFARAMYMFNTMAEVTRRAASGAANVDFNNSSALDVVRKRAVLNEDSGRMPIGEPITYKNVHIDYLYLGPKGSGLELQEIPAGSMPSCPAKNRVICMQDPYSTSCIRAVRARICVEDSGTAGCTPVQYQPMIRLIQLPLRLPTSATIATVESLGYQADASPCP